MHYYIILLDSDLIELWWQGFLVVEEKAPVLLLLFDLLSPSASADDE